MLNGIKLLLEKKDRNIGEVKQEWWIRELAFFINVTGHVSNLDKHLQGKISSLPRCTTRARPFEVNLWLWGNQLKLHNLVHFPQLKCLGTVYSERNLEYSHSIPLLQEEFGKRFYEFKTMRPEYFFYPLPLKVDNKRLPRRSENWIN